MKNKTPKPRVMWANYHPTLREPIVHATQQRAKIFGNPAGVKAIRVAVIPLSDVEAIVERARKAAMATNSHLFVDLIRAALTAAGIPCRKASK